MASLRRAKHGRRMGSHIDPHPAYTESPNARSACWSVPWSAHKERCRAGPSEFPEAYRKGPMHAPVSTPMHVMDVHSWHSCEAMRAWRPWGERNVHTITRKLARKALCIHPMRQALGRPCIGRAHACHACMQKGFPRLVIRDLRPQESRTSSSAAPARIPPRQLEIRTAGEPYAQQSRGRYPSFRKFWGESSTPNPSSCSHAWGFKHHSNNYKAPSCFLS